MHSSQFTVVHMAADGLVQSASWVGTYGSQYGVVSEQLKKFVGHGHVHKVEIRQFPDTGGASRASNDKPALYVRQEL